MTDPECEFCGIVRGDRPARIVGESSEALAFFPLRPVVPGHTLVIPKEHVRDLWSPSAPGPALMEAVRWVGQALTLALRPDGLNLISSAGEAASQTVFHLHLHLIPRWSGDRLGNIWPPSEPLSDHLEDETAAAISAAYNTIRAEPGENDQS
jgi:histidine triad (HIT) family protein